MQSQFGQNPPDDAPPVSGKPPFRHHARSHRRSSGVPGPSAKGRRAPAPKRNEMRVLIAFGVRSRVPQLARHRIALHIVMRKTS